MCVSCVRHAQTARIIEFVFLKPFECEYTMENNPFGPVPAWLAGSCLTCVLLVGIHAIHFIHYIPHRAPSQLQVPGT